MQQIKLLYQIKIFLKYIFHKFVMTNFYEISKNFAVGFRTLSADCIIGFLSKPSIENKTWKNNKDETFVYESLQFSNS
jgi:hypothetical protein